MRALVKIILSTLAVMVAAYIVPGVTLGGFWVAVAAAIVLGILNFFVRPILILFTLPITILTLGLFMLVINALLVLLASKIVPGFEVAGFWSALFFSLVVSLVNALLNRWGNQQSNV